MTLVPSHIALPWNDRQGRFSTLKAVTLAGVFAPALWIGWQAIAGTLGSKPLTSAIHQSGDWAVQILLISLLVTPLRDIASWPKLILVRRMLGLAALAYAVLHLGLYIALEAFDLAKVVREITVRVYLTIGFVALLGLLVLGATSTDGMIRRLGAVGWNRLHMIVYGLAVLALVHYFLQSKIDVTQAVIMAGFFFWLMGYRLVAGIGAGTSVQSLAGLAVAAAILTALVEATWYATMTGVMAERVLLANLDFTYSIRPAWWVLGAGVAAVAICLARSRHRQPRRQRQPLKVTA